VDPTTSSSWRRLVALVEAGDLPTIAESFDAVPDRVASLSVDLEFPGGAMLVDFSKQNVTPEIVDVLLALARETGVTAVRDAMFDGEVVNASENQPALHTAMRAPDGSRVEVDGRDVIERVRAERKEADVFARDVRNGIVHGSDGRPFTHVLNVGIGGSDLGPALVYGAWASSREPDLECRFVSNVDPVSLERTLATLDPARTLVVMCSKSFGTSETLANCLDVQSWLAAALGTDAVAAHSVMVSARPERATESGLVARRTFESWQWVGGRYSISSAMNLANSIAFGPELVDEFLDGMRAIDVHFRTAEPHRNVPMLMGLINVWNRSLLGRPSRAMVVYQDALRGFVDYVQQLEMESNGKSVLADGRPVSTETAPIVWGGVGTNAQHAFMQLVHQGTTVVPVDFIGVASTSARNSARHDELIANMFAQAEALAFGRRADEMRRMGVGESIVNHRVAPGNRPSTTILLSGLSASSLGALIALYEHAVVVQGAVLGINSFDQWGVELGKRLAETMVDDLGQKGGATSRDPSTSALIRWYGEHR
jgi:glucose-6-phosphate isomerase